MNYIDALGQEIKIGDLVVFSSTVGGSRGTCIHFAEVTDIRPAKEDGVNCNWIYPHGTTWVRDSSGLRQPPERIASGVDFSVQTIYTTSWFERNDSVRVRKSTTPKTINILKWTGPDPRETKATG